MLLHRAQYLVPESSPYDPENAINAWLMFTKVSGLMQQEVLTPKTAAVEQADESSLLDFKSPGAALYII